MKYCIDCKHCRRLGKAGTVCASPLRIRISRVHGEYTVDKDCKEARESSDHDCGEDGAWFEPKPSWWKIFG